MSKPIKIFFSYAAKDEELRDELATHLTILKRQGKIEDWYEGDIDAGSERAAEIKAQLTSANIILLLVSPSFISSDHNYLQMQWAMTRRESGQAEVIPIILRPTTGWENETFGKLQPLPRGGTPVTSWPDRDEAFAHITEGILKVAEGLTKRSVASRQSAPTSTSAKSTAAVEPQASAVEYNTGAIRKLLRAAFSDEEFMIFCYDNFRDVHDQFSTGMSFTQKTQRLIEYCERNMAFETLLHLVEAENPAQYQRFASQVKL